MQVAQDSRFLHLITAEIIQTFCYPASLYVMYLWARAGIPGFGSKVERLGLLSVCMRRLVSQILTGRTMVSCTRIAGHRLQPCCCPEMNA